MFVEDFADGLSTWDQDAINVTDFGFDNRQVNYDGAGVYVAVFGYGLAGFWRQYFRRNGLQKNMRLPLAAAAGSWVSFVPAKQMGARSKMHGTHVTSTILGYNLGGVPVNGAAPMATVIPVKVLNQNGSAGLRFARGITYVADLKSPARWQITL